MEFLSTKGRNIVNESGEVVYLRGTCIGGWMNLEDFINGYPGTANTLKRQMKQAIGEELTTFYFNRMADYFFTEADVAHIASLRANCIRIPLNYRDFEDDENPFVYKEEPHIRLSNALDWCEKHGVYAILDMHAAAGWQNNHWHCDNERGACMLWRHPHFQERLISWWQHMAKRYKDRAVVAGYELLNEPNTGNPDGEHPYDFYGNYKPDWERINSLYQRLVSAIREIDTRHIIILEGDNYGRYFSGLSAPFAENLVYSNHNYVMPGFGPGAYPGHFSSPYGQAFFDQGVLRKEIMKQEGYKFQEKYNVPLLVGEFGSQYNGPPEDIPHRLASMKDQLDIYNELGLNWTSWTYKDCNVMGWVTLKPENSYMQLVKEVQENKRHMGAENFVAQHKPSEGRIKARELSEVIRRASIIEYKEDDTAYTFNYAALTGFAAAMLQPAYAALFKGKTKEELDQILTSYQLEHCNRNIGLEDILKEALN